MKTKWRPVQESSNNAINCALSADGPTHNDRSRDVVYSLEALSGSWSDTNGSHYEVSINSDQVVKIITTRPNGHQIVSKDLVHYDSSDQGWIVWGRNARKPESQYWLSKMSYAKLLWERPGYKPFAWERVGCSSSSPQDCRSSEQQQRNASHFYHGNGNGKNNEQWDKDQDEQLYAGWTTQDEADEAALNDPQPPNNTSCWLDDEDGPCECCECQLKDTYLEDIRIPDLMRQASIRPNYRASPTRWLDDRTYGMKDHQFLWSHRRRQRRFSKSRSQDEKIAFEHSYFHSDENQDGDQLGWARPKRQLWSNYKPYSRVAPPTVETYDMYDPLGSPQRQTWLNSNSYDHHVAAPATAVESRRKDEFHQHSSSRSPPRPASRPRFEDEGCDTTSPRPSRRPPVRATKANSNDWAVVARRSSRDQWEPRKGDQEQRPRGQCGNGSEKSTATSKWLDDGGDDSDEEHDREEQTTPLPRRSSRGRRVSDKEEVVLQDRMRLSTDDTLRIILRLSEASLWVVVRSAFVSWSALSKQTAAASAVAAPAATVLPRDNRRNGGAASTNKAYPAKAATRERSGYGSGGVVSAPHYPPEKNQSCLNSRGSVPMAIVERETPHVGTSIVKKKAARAKVNSSHAQGTGLDDVGGSWVRIFCPCRRNGANSP